MSYDSFAKAVTEDGTITDPWIDGAPRFREEPLVLAREEWRALATAAEEIAGVYDEMCRVVSDEPPLLDEVLRADAAPEGDVGVLAAALARHRARRRLRHRRRASPAPS